MVCELGISWKKKILSYPSPHHSLQKTLCRRIHLKNSLFPPLYLFTKNGFIVFLFSATFEIHFLRAKDPRSCSHFLPKARLVVKTKIPFFRQNLKFKKILNRIKCAMMPFRLFLS